MILLLLLVYSKMSEKRKRDPLDQKLSKLEPIFVEQFIQNLLRESRKSMAAMITAFEGRAPTYMYYLDDKSITSKMIAYAVGKRTVNGTVNSKPITVQEVKSEAVQEKVDVYVGRGMDEAEAKRKAKKKLFKSSPQSNQDISAFFRQVQELIAFAEGSVMPVVLNQLNGDSEYIKAKEVRCPILFIEAIRRKAAQGSDNAHLNRERLLDQLRRLFMEGKNQYITYKETFLSLVHSLRICDSTIEESQLINMYLAHLDQNIFFRIHNFRIDTEGIKHPIQDLHKLNEVVSKTDKMFNFYIESERSTKRAKNEPGTQGNGSSMKGNGSANGNSNNNSNSSNAAEETVLPPGDGGAQSALEEASTDIQVMAAETKICKFFKKYGNCKRGDKCKFSHE